MRKYNLIIALIACLFAFTNANAQFTKTVVAFSGEILDQVTKKPVSVVVEVYNEDGTKFNKAKSNAKDGSYYVTGLVPGSNYIFRIADLKYLKLTFDVQIPNTDKYVEYTKDIQLVPANKNIEFALNVSPFEINQASLRPGFEFFLKDYIKLIKDNVTVNFAINAYPDNNLDPIKNKILTQARTEAIKEYFIKCGIDPKRLNVNYFDKTDPKNPPPTGKAAKGKKYVGSIYLQITSF